MSSEHREISPANEFYNFYSELYEKPHRNIAIINAGIQKGSKAWHLLLNHYLKYIMKAKVITIVNGQPIITLDFKKLLPWEQKALINFSYMIDELATRVMSNSPRTHSAHRATVDRFNIGAMNTNISQIPGLGNLEEEPKRKSNETSSIEDWP